MISARLNLKLGHCQGFHVDFSVGQLLNFACVCMALGHKSNFIKNSGTVAFENANMPYTVVLSVYVTYMVRVSDVSKFNFILQIYQHR